MRSLLGVMAKYYQRMHRAGPRIGEIFEAQDNLAG